MTCRGEIGFSDDCDWLVTVLFTFINGCLLYHNNINVEYKGGVFLKLLSELSYCIVNYRLFDENNNEPIIYFWEAREIFLLQKYVLFSF